MQLAQIKSKKLLLLLMLSVVLVAFFTSCGRSSSRSLLILDSINSNKTWDDIKSSQSKISSFRVINTGSVLVPRSGVINSKKLPLDSNIEEEIWVDVFAFLFHHANRGWTLIDTGLDSTYQNEGNLSGVMVARAIRGFKQRKGQNIKAQLEEDNIKLSEIYFTHLHADHTAGLPELPHNIPLYAGKGETIVNFPLLFSHKHFQGIQNIIEIDWENGQTRLPFRSVIDLFGDQSFWAISTPGHTDSNLSYLVFTDQEPVLLTGDASHTKYGFENNIEPGWVDNEEVANQSLMQLTQFKQEHPETRVIYGHEL